MENPVPGVLLLNNNSITVRNIPNGTFKTYVARIRDYNPFEKYKVIRFFLRPNENGKQLDANGDEILLYSGLGHGLYEAKIPTVDNTPEKVLFELTPEGPHIIEYGHDAFFTDDFVKKYFRKQEALDI